jgi:hypothetical protein
MEWADTLEEFIDMLLYDVHVVGVGQDLYQLVIWDEVKPWEKSSLYFKVVLKFLLYLLQKL